MKQLFVITLVILFASCTQNQNQIVVPVSNFTITLNGHTYSESSDANHPIVASVVVGKDLYANYSISLASVSVNSKNIFTGFSGQNTNVSYGTGKYFLGIRDAKDSMECPYVLIDKGAANTYYVMDTVSSFTITQNDAHTVTGYFNFNLRHFPGDSLIFPATGSFTYNLYYGTH